MLPPEDDFKGLTSDNQDGPKRGDQGGGDEGMKALTHLGLRLSAALEHVYMTQGLSIKDLVWVIHGLLGQVLSWSYR